MSGLIKLDGPVGAAFTILREHYQNNGALVDTFDHNRIPCSLERIDYRFNPPSELSTEFDWYQVSADDKAIAFIGVCPTNTNEFCLAYPS